MERWSHMEYHSSLGLLLGPDGNTDAGIDATDPISDEYAASLGEAIASIRRYARQQSFSVVTRNYENFRRIFDGAITKFFADGRTPPGDASEVMFDLTASLLNWLLAFRLFVDHTASDLSRRFGKKSPERIVFDDATSAEYDSVFSYRLMYRMRNYAQHAGMPAHGLNLSSRLVPTDDGSEYVQQSLSFFFDRDGLLRNFKKWGPQVTAELLKQAEHLEVEPHVSATMDALNRIMRKVVEVEMPSLLSSARMMREAVSRLDQSKGGQPAIFKFALERDPKQVSFQTIPVGLLALVEGLALGE
jgi:hypothetical protein